MDYQNKIKEIIYNNSEYFPFEWIRSFKMRNKSLPLADEEEKEYKFLLETSKKCCEELIREYPENRIEKSFAKKKLNVEKTIVKSIAKKF